MAWKDYTNDSDTHTWENSLTANVTTQPSRILLGDTTAAAVEKTNNAIDQTVVNTQNIVVLTEAVDELEDAVANAGQVDEVQVGGTNAVVDKKVNFVAGSNVILTPSNGTVTVSVPTVPAANVPYDNADFPNVGSMIGAIISGDETVGNAASAKKDGKGNIIDETYIPASQKGANSGVAELDATGKVPQSQLPSYVDDVLEYSSLSAFPSVGETGKIYVALDTNKQYRWSGSQYTVISETLALGETSSTAYAGDKGKANADAIAGIKADYVRSHNIFTDGEIIIANGTGGRQVRASGRAVVDSISGYTSTSDVPSVMALQNYVDARTVELTISNLWSHTDIDENTAIYTYPASIYGFVPFNVYNKSFRMVVVDVEVAENELKITCDKTLWEDQLIGGKVIIGRLNNY